MKGETAFRVAVLLCLASIASSLSHIAWHVCTQAADQHTMSRLAIRNLAAAAQAEAVAAEQATNHTEKKGTVSHAKVSGKDTASGEL